MFMNIPRRRERGGFLPVLGVHHSAMFGIRIPLVPLLIPKEH